MSRLSERFDWYEPHQKWIRGESGGDRANLDGATLDGATLDGASLKRANLDGASLDGANLNGASLDGATLDGANLDGANLNGASLDGASLDGARFADGFTGTEDTKVRQLTGVGSEGGTLVIINCAEGHFINRGCFRGSVSEFLDAVEKTHGDNEHGAFYRGIMGLYCKKEFEEWKAQREGGE